MAVPVYCLGWSQAFLIWHLSSVDFSCCVFWTVNSLLGKELQNSTLPAWVCLQRGRIIAHTSLRDTAQHSGAFWIAAAAPWPFYSILSWLPGKSLMLQVEADYLTSCNVWRSSIGSIGASTITWLIVWLCVCIVCRRHLKSIKAKEPSCIHDIYIYICIPIILSYTSTPVYYI